MTNRALVREIPKDEPFHSLRERVIGPSAAQIKRQKSQKARAFLIYRNKVTSSQLLFKLCEKFCALHDVALVRPFSDGFLFIENLNREADARTVNQNDFDFGADDEAHRYRFVMLEIDVRSERDLTVAEHGRDTRHRRVFH